LRGIEFPCEDLTAAEVAGAINRQHARTVAWGSVPPLEIVALPHTVPLPAKVPPLETPPAEPAEVEPFTASLPSAIGVISC
jgi:hypothetical protein